MNRKLELLPDNWWHGPYATMAESETQARHEAVREVRLCQICRPQSE